MQRIINDPDQVVEDYLKGFVKAHKEIVSATGHPRVLKRVLSPQQGKVGVVTGGGSGHKPAFVGYIGRNLVDSVAVGEVFSSPTAKAFHEAIKAADGGAGVAVLYGNYAGDNMNVKMAIEDAGDDGITVKTVVANDDVASAPAGQRHKRRGVAGEVLMWKVGGAKAALGGSLDEVVEVAQRAIDNTRSVGIGLAPCTIAAVGKPNFTIADGTMEFGIGHHGEPGMFVQPIVSASEMAKIALEKILEDFNFEHDERLVVLVSGLGSTPVMELYIFYDEVESILTANGHQVDQAFVGNYFTSLDMAGITLTVMKLDDELRELVHLGAHSVGFHQE
jgi:dihydroxyacetone kinase-like protein